MIWKTRLSGQQLLRGRSQMPAELCGSVKCCGGAFKGYTHKNARGNLQLRDGRNDYICNFMTCC